MAKGSSEVDVTVDEAAERYFESLSARAAQGARPAVKRFVQWLGPDRKVASLTSVDVERFAEESAGRGGSQGRNIEPVRPFLAHLKNAGLTKTNLSTAIKVKRSEGETSAASAADRVEMTRAGYEGLQRELEALVGQRPQIAEALRQAMADKDFRENAPLDAARDQQAHVEAQIRRIEGILKKAVIVDAGANAAGTAHVGSVVKVVNLDSNVEMRYQLVSPNEVNPREGKISVASPVGKALLERAPGDEVSVSVPAGTQRLRVLAVDD